MKELTTFEFQGHKLRVIEYNGNPWFIGKQVCRALGIVNHKDAISRLSPHQKSVVGIADPHGRVQDTNIISEGGLYKLSFRSNKPEAEEFTDLVCDVILPSIRKTGSYSMNAHEQLQNEIAMLQFVQNAVDKIFQAISQRWIVEDSERVFYGKSAMDHLRIEVCRANRHYTEVGKYFHGPQVFDGFDARGRLAKFQMDIRNGRVVETQMRMPFSNE